MPEPIHLAAIILAAGASSRMGQPKLLLRWGSGTILSHLVSIWKSLASQTTVVCAPAPHPVHAELDRLGFPPASRIINSFPDEGMFSSIQAAARWRDWDPRLTHFALVLGDQPQISKSTLEQLLEHTRKNRDAICQTSLHGRPKHPVILPRTVFTQLRDTQRRTLREFLQASPARRCLIESGDESLAVDLDTPADYVAALRLQR